MLTHYLASKEDLLVGSLRFSHQQFFTRVDKCIQCLLGLDAIRVIMAEAMPSMTSDCLSANGTGPEQASTGAEQAGTAGRRGGGEAGRMRTG